MPPTEFESTLLLSHKLPIGRVLVMKHSRMGIASFVISLTIWILMVALIIGNTEVVAGYDLSNLIRLLLLGGFVVGTGLGISGLLQRKRKKTFAVMGILLSLSFLTLIDPRIYLVPLDAIF